VKQVRQDGLEAVLKRGPVVPVIVIESLAHAVPLARALVQGGLTVLEVTLRTPVALDAVRAIRAEVEGAICGVGTVLTPGQLAEAEAAGAMFAVSPGTTPGLLDAAADSAVPLLPGAATASEIMALLERGITLQKFFPAEAAGGAAALGSFASPLSRARFCPTGGVTPANARAYLSLPNVLCVGGSWMLPKAAVQAGDWEQVQRLAADASALR
jgi:2-dehydro-3-deoxyphosphogluconate aldolase / (4S)-4-hydroxy-2-oxoglutarate aldolase